MEYSRIGNHVAEVTSSDGTEQRRTVSSYYQIHLKAEDENLLNDGADTETVTVTIRDGLEVASGTDPANSTVLDYDGDVTISVNDNTTTKTLTNGSVTFDVTTTKSAGSEIEIAAESLTNHPAESDSATIEVVSA
jgi:hypothetical protein